MNKKKLIAICIALLAVLLTFAFEWVKLGTYVGVGFVWCATVMALTGYTLSLVRRGEQDRALKYAMVLGGVGMVMTVAVKALFAGLGLCVALSGEDSDGALSLALIYAAALWIVKPAGMVCSAVAIAMLPRLRLWIASVAAINLAITPLVLVLLIVFAPLLLVLAIILGISTALNFFLWIGFFVQLYAFYRLNCRKEDSNEDEKLTISVPDLSFSYQKRHVVADEFPIDDEEIKDKVQHRNVWALSLWGDVDKVEIAPSNTPWKMAPHQYKKICSDVGAVDTVPFEITSPARGAGEIWYIIPEGGIDFVVLLDEMPISGKTPINAGNKVALQKKGVETIIGRLDVKRRILVETRTITSPRV